VGEWGERAEGLTHRAAVIFIAELERLLTEAVNRPSNALPYTETAARLTKQSRGE
jgi:hypothetical protein